MSSRIFCVFDKLIRGGAQFLVVVQPVQESDSHRKPEHLKYACLQTNSLRAAAPLF